MGKRIIGALIFFGIFLTAFGVQFCTLKAQELSGLFTNQTTWVQQFDSLVGIHSSGLINGSLYQTQYINAQIHPFWQGRDWKSGSLHYQGQFYPQVALMYDAFTDQLILRHIDERNLNNWLLLFKEEIRFFTLQEKYFEYLGSESNKKLASGFYEILYKGKNLKLVAKRYKEDYIEEKTIQFREKSSFYLLYQNSASNLNHEKDFLELFASRKVEINNFIRQNQLKIKPSQESDLIRLSEFCDQLIPLP